MYAATLNLSKIRQSIKCTTSLEPLEHAILFKFILNNIVFAGFHSSSCEILTKTIYKF